MHNVFNLYDVFGTFYSFCFDGENAVSSPLLFLKMPTIFPELEKDYWKISFNKKRKGTEALLTPSHSYFSRHLESQANDQQWAQLSTWGDWNLSISWKNIPTVPVNSLFGCNNPVLHTEMNSVSGWTQAPQPISIIKSSLKCKQLEFPPSSEYCILYTILSFLGFVFNGNSNSDDKV